MPSKKKPITRKDFITKTGKCMGGIVCAPMALSIFQSCDKPDITNSIDDDTQLVATCDWHEAKFDQDGLVVQNPNGGNGNPFSSLTQYDAEIVNDEMIVLIDFQDDPINLSEHSTLLEIGGFSFVDTHPANSDVGLLLYRKSQDEIMVFSRTCPHMGGTIGPFEEQ